jgi:hypothetical protein
MLELIEDDGYAKLQATLANGPDTGKIIPGSGGVRKMRWAGSGRGKRGGLRVICYWCVADDQIGMLLAYPKSDKDDLTRDEIRKLKKLVDAFLL